MSKWDLDTPALVIDLDKLERNIATMQARLSALGVGARPHAKTHKCSAIARLQLAAGAVGVCAAKLSEAEALHADGIRKILMTTANFSTAKIRRAMQLRLSDADFVQAVDHPHNAQDLSDAAKEAGVTADVVIDVAAGTRSGVPPGEQAVELAQLVDRLPGLKLRGLLCYDGAAQHIKGYATRREAALGRAQPAVRTCERMRELGLNTEIFSGGGTGTYDIMPTVPGLTDVQVGSYVFMDTQYLEIGGARGDTFDDFEPSLTMLTTIVNDYFPKCLTTDAGTKAVTLNQPWPIVIGEPGFRYSASSDEFGSIEYDTSSRAYRAGDKLELIVSHCDPVVNEFDLYYGIRNDRVEVVWPVTARGRSQ
jgi:D-serine deaminase-like pyridoxal phosphate-dependent protein